MKLLKTAITAAITGLLLTTIHAAIIRVPQDQPTIAAGVAAANSGDTILISDGTYNEGGIVITQSLTLQSVNGNAITTVNAQNLGGIFLINTPTNNTVVIQGLTMTGANVSAGFTAVRRIAGMLQVSDCVFTGNYADGGVIDARGGVDYSILEPQKTLVIDCIFTNNNAENMAGILGATAVRCLLCNNTGWNNPCVLMSCNSTNCTVYNNTGGVSGNPWTTGGMSGGTADNCIFWGNSGYNGQQVDQTTPATITYSIVRSGYSGTGNLTSDPLFVNAASGDFHLQTNSPAKNSGDPTILNADGSRSDMGAYGGNNATFPPSFLTNGLVAYYPFNGNANDASGNGNNGAVFDATLTTDRFGNPNAAYYFNGTNSYIDIPQNSVLNSLTTNFTLSAWIFEQEYTTNVPLRIIDKTLAKLSDGWLLDACDCSSQYPDRLRLQGVAYNSCNVEGGTVFSAMQWHHVVATVSGTNGSVYLDGNLDGFGYVGNIPVNTLDVFIGTAHPEEGAGLNNWFNGQIDDVRIYNRALSSNEVAQLYAYESTPVVSAPNITSQPVSQIANQGSPVSFSVTASGTGLNYQWQFNTTNILGATNASYYIASATTNNSGNYAVVVSNSGGSVTSSNAVLTVIPPPRTGTGTAVLTGSFVTSVNITDGGSGYTNTPLVRLIGGGGSGAGAYAVVSNGMVISVTVTNAGYGYTNAPLVVIDPPFISNPVLGIAPYSFLAFSNLTVGGDYQLQQSLAWYWTNQPVSFTATNSLYTQMVPGVDGNYRLALNPVPTQAFATAQLYNDFVVGVTVTSGGSGYVTSPAITIVGGGGIGAGAYATLSGGVVTGIIVTNAGFDYTNAPTVRIAAPPAAAVAPTVFPVMRVDSASLAPYDNYQIQFMPKLGGTWDNWNGGLFTPTDVTNSQFLFITNSTGFFRLEYVP